MLAATIAIGLLGACSIGREKHSDIMSHAEMVKTLMDIYVAEQQVARLSLTTDSATKVLYQLKSKIFEKTKVSDSVFNKSFNYYVDRPAELEEIYVTLVDSLTLKEQLLNVSPP